MTNNPEDSKNLDEVEHFLSRLTLCCGLFSPDCDDGTANGSLSARTSRQQSSFGDILKPLNSNASEASIRRRNIALAASKILKEVLNPVPVAGGFLSAGFGVASIFLERRKVGNISLYQDCYD